MGCSASNSRSQRNRSISGDDSNAEVAAISRRRFRTVHTLRQRWSVVTGGGGGGGEGNPASERKGEEEDELASSRRGPSDQNAPRHLSEWTDHSDLSLQVLSLPAGPTPLWPRSWPTWQFHATCVGEARSSIPSRLVPFCGFSQRRESQIRADPTRIDREVSSLDSPADRRTHPSLSGIFPSAFSCSWRPLRRFVCLWWVWGFVPAGRRQHDSDWAERHEPERVRFCAFLLLWAWDFVRWCSDLGLMSACDLLVGPNVAASLDGLHAISAIGTLHLLGVKMSD
jgi:hypothetical protein